MSGSAPASSVQPPSASNRSYAFALRGPEEVHARDQQAWILVGENDIIPSISNGVKSLTLSEGFKDKLCKPWSRSVVIRLLSKSFGYSFLCQRLHAIWKPMGHLHIVDLDRTCFLVKFGNDQDYFKALTGGPWIIFDRYLIVHQWDESFRVSNELPHKLVAWVRFPHLPIQFYHAKILAYMGNLIGKTIKIDFTTQRVDRWKFARIAVEIDLNLPLPPVIELDGCLQLVEYENIPTLCLGCGRGGHAKEECPLSTGCKSIVVKEPLNATGKDLPPAAMTSETFGPWMIATRRRRKPLLESNSKMERAKDAHRSPMKDYGKSPVTGMLQILLCQNLERKILQQILRRD
ncbi:hypothetical protein LINPERHAP1_LOCUS17527 [Linum perenne]